VQELEHARIGSRPARRSQKRGLEDLRAIPWVFGWMQSRHVLPGYFGVGYALERFLEAEAGNEALLQTMLRKFPLFEDMIRNVETGLAKADLTIARRYADLVADAGVRSAMFGAGSAEAVGVHTADLASPQSDCWRPVPCWPKAFAAHPSSATRSAYRRAMVRSALASPVSTLRIMSSNRGNLRSMVCKSASLPASASRKRSSA